MFHVPHSQYYGSGSWMAKSLRIQIHNTGIIPILDGNMYCTLVTVSSILQNKLVLVCVVTRTILENSGWDMNAADVKKAERERKAYWKKLVREGLSWVQNRAEVPEPDAKIRWEPVLRIRIHRIHMFLGLSDPDPLVRGMGPDPSIIMQKQ